MTLNIAGRTRKDILDAALRSGKVGAHIAPSLSIVEIMLSVLQKSDKSKDVVVLSKGHGALGYYAAMHQLGIITDAQFASFEENGGDFPGQPCRSDDNKIQYSSGSLGMGLSYAAGRAWADKCATAYVVMGDGELNEGSVWEAAAFAARHKLNNIVVVVDMNGLQSDGRCCDVMAMDAAKIWRAFGWQILECDGHDMLELTSQLNSVCSDGPCTILAKTVKGKGVSFMENDNKWHHSELKDKQYQAALAEIGERYGSCA